MRFETVLITPPMAARIVAKNSSNRPLRLGHVNYLSRCMTNKEFKTTHQGIAIDRNGNMVDGQHRLHAIMQSGIPQRMVIAYDVEADTFGALDQGLKRTHADILNAPTKLVEVSRLAATIISGRKGAPTTQEVVNVHEVLQHPVSELLESYTGATRTITSAPMKLAAALKILEGEGSKYVNALYRDMAARNYDELPAVGKVLVRQVDSGKIDIRLKVDVLGRGLVVFTKKSADFKKIHVPENEDTVAYVRKVMKSLTEA